MVGDGLSRPGVVLRMSPMRSECDPRGESSGAWRQAASKSSTANRDTSIATDPLPRPRAGALESADIPPFARESRAVSKACFCRLFLHPRPAERHVELT